MLVFLFLLTFVLGDLSFACIVPVTPTGGGTATLTMPIQTGTPTATATVAPATAATTGAITGSVNCPSEFVPAQRVVAFDAADYSVYYYVATSNGQTDYSITVPVGIYHVVAYLMDGMLAGGYTQMVPCGLQAGCDDHSLIDVVVNGGETVMDITPFDWYATSGAFPEKP